MFHFFLSSWFEYYILRKMIKESKDLTLEKKTDQEILQIISTDKYLEKSDFRSEKLTGSINFPFAIVVFNPFIYIRQNIILLDVSSWKTKFNEDQIEVYYFVDRLLSGLYEMCSSMKIPLGDFTIDLGKLRGLKNETAVSIILEVDRFLID